MPTVLGLIINPIAGMGGSVALHGTDGPSLQRALELGAVPVADARTRRALARIAHKLPDLLVLAAPGMMGADQARALGFQTDVVDLRVGDVTTADDTLAAAREMRDRGVTLLLFGGGDGTAHDVVSVVDASLPILGVPAGVKMHSGVFGTTPEAAGDIAVRFLRRPDETPVREAEVLDVEDSDPADTRLLGVARVPYVMDLVQRSKASPVFFDEGAIQAVCSELADEMDSGRYYIIGPGTTTARILEALGLATTLNGVDVVRDGALVAVDASEQVLLGILEDKPPASIVLGVIGGQGFLLGRGNQQISSSVIAAVGEENVLIVASAEKITALDPPVLRVDFGVERAVTPLLGYRRVLTGPGTTTMLKVVS